MGRHGPAATALRSGLVPLRDRIFNPTARANGILFGVKNLFWGRIYPTSLIETKNPHQLVV